MASQQSNITSTSTVISTQEPLTPPTSTTSTGMTTSNAIPTVTTTTPVLTDAVQRCVNTAAEAIATNREARISFLQSLVRKMMRETLKETPNSNPPSAGIPTTQSGINGAPTRGIYPSFVIHPNYHNGQIHHPSNPNSQPPTTGTTSTTGTTAAKLTSTQNISTTKTSLATTTAATATTTTTSYPNTLFSPATHRPHTVFAPMSLVESLTKTNLLLVADMKSGLQSIHNDLSSIPLENIRNEQLQNFDTLNDKIGTLEKNFTELKDIVLKRSYQNLKIDPKILDQWNPSMIVIRRSPWTNMRLILNKVAADNTADLFPNDWAPKPCFSDIQEKHYKVLSEVMTEMFYQCGILQDYDVLAIQGYEQFIKALHHHMILGNVTLHQLGHFLILMTYMSFCRLGHYSEYMNEEDSINLEIAVWMSLVIVAFRTSFHAEGAHRTINPYFNLLNTNIRRILHVILTRYLEQDCICKNHVQCDISPHILTSEIILPSYEHFLHYIMEQGLSKFSIVGESEILSKYGKTITMIVLARINGYYSPFFPQSIMEEEGKCLYGTNFSFAEKDFFLNKLLKETPHMSKAAIDQSIAFLERQKEANCPCTIHTQKRGFDWIVFNRLPDRVPPTDDGYHGTGSCENAASMDSDQDENEEARVTEPISNHELMEQVNNQKNGNTTEASNTSSEIITSADLTARYNSIFNPSVDNSSCELSHNSRDDVAKHTKSQKIPKNNKTKKTRKLTTSELKILPNDMLEESRQKIDSKIPCKFDQIVYMDNVSGITYSFRYFHAYKFDWRVVMNYQNEEPMLCTCPRGRLHNEHCPWYHPEVINVPDIENTLSTSEQAAQGKIYDLYHHHSQNMKQELCGCGTAAEIAYMGHKSTCEEFQWMNERSSYEMLLAVLKKRRKATLCENFQQQHKRPRLQSPSSYGTEEDSSNPSQADVNMDNPNTSPNPTTATNPLAVLAEVAQSHSQSSLPNVIGEQNGGNGGAECPFEDDEEMPLLEDANSTEL